MKTIRTKALIDQHLHGAYGVDFLGCSADDLIYCAERLKQDGVTMFLPTLATAPAEILKRQINVIKTAMNKKHAGAKIYGANLEACFISPEKRGIHEVSQLLAPTVENFKLFEDECIKIVTIAPELDKNNELASYLHSKGIKVFAGHTAAHDLSEADGVTHLYNAMAGIKHREKNTVTSALLDDSVFCEIIADGFHVDYDNVKLVYKTKPADKIILISDALPIAGSDKIEMEFCSKKIYLKDGMATDANGVLAGSSMLLPQIVKKLVKNSILDLETAVKSASNSAKLFNVEFNDEIIWGENLDIIEVLQK